MVQLYHSFFISLWYNSINIQKGENMKIRILSLITVAVVILGVVSACARDADVASQNISNAADNFQVYRRIVFYNGITNDYILEVRGYCSLGNADPAKELTVTCKTETGQYLKHFLGLSDNVTYFAEQLTPATVSQAMYKVTFKPLTIVPDIEVRP
jgi:hypothetical protein